MIFSAYQQAIFTFVTTTTRNLVVRAGAGSGKTTTLVEIINRLTGTTIFLAFGKAIAEELKKRGVNARTFHSLTYVPVTRFFGAREVRKDKIRELIRERYSDKDQQTYGAFVDRLVRLAKNAGIGCLVDDTEQNWDDLAAKHDLEIDTDHGDYKTGIDLARKMLAISNEAAKRGLIDFDDLLYLAVKEGIKLPHFDNGLLDEAQDTNAIQRAILRKVIDRLVAVGDESQAIYGFRGADSEAMELIRTEFDADVLPLTVSYRCATAIVNHASQFGVIEAAPGAKEGAVTTLKAEEIITSTKAGDLVVSRITKPLIELAYDLMRARKPAYVMGSEIGKGLVNLINKQKAKGIEQLRVKLNESTTREVEKAKAKGDDAKAERAEDRADCIFFLIDTLDENHRTIPELIRVIEGLFADKNDAVVLATVHKSKGLEADRVFWLGHNFVSKWARQDWQKQQEKNLRYVAATRAKSELFLIPTTTKAA